MCGIQKQTLTQRSHLQMKSRAIINIVYRHRVITEARQSVGKGAHKPSVNDDFLEVNDDLWRHIYSRLVSEPFRRVCTVQTS